MAHLVLDQSALALTIGMAGAVLLLLAGTEILDWYWVVLLAAASLGVGLYRLRNRIPSTYRMAQRIDRRLNLADALSTATFFSSETAHGDPAIRRRQHQEAENIARTIDVRAGVPFTRPRYAYAAIGVTLVALGMFALRFAVTGSLSLKPNLVTMAFDTFFPPHQELAKNTKKPADRGKSTADDEDSPDDPTTQSEEKPDAEIQPVDTPDESNPQADDKSKQAGEAADKSEPQNDKPGDNADKDDKSNNSNNADQQSSKEGDAGANKQQNSQQDAKQQSDSQNENSSLMDKLRDAVASMMNKMKPSPKQGDQSQQKGQNSQQKGNADKNQKQQSAKNDKDQKSDTQSDQSSDNSDQSQSAQSRGNEKSTDQNAAQDAKSGIGSADGDKNTKLAEQLAAMGKISEIFGKRSQNVTGEVMVEVGSSRQQLKTPWAQRQATHVEAGSEIHRDEVPLIYQQFVEQYFEEIHKSPAPASKKNN